ncbi:MAG: hypothetical protein LKE39_02700 [Sphaerochaeta sp.]|jgi:hypothetical protein|nr:hypothetical protein [Sphaerochaeta sp.]MCH3919391.1 hypothetical protein [Sphaerochaeta sp.]MCI2075974.1 hypothetical protein [Sphaerochaeta sp.]MCI2097590.1 hypothetical protein [Sphaerochaeta sp.]MCI2104802.1 hypothetical protein [Sphaerochaeta sp.]
MRKRLVMLSLLILFSVLPVFARSFGYSVSYGGEQRITTSYRSGTLGLVYQPWEREFLNPAVTLQTSVGENPEGQLSVTSTTLVLDADLFRTLNHPFWFVAHNRIAYDPSVGVGVQMRWDEQFRATLYLTASPIKFSQPDFLYEALSPFFTYDSTGWRWGVALFRFTFLFL